MVKYLDFHERYGVPCRFAQRLAPKVPTLEKVWAQQGEELRWNGIARRYGTRLHRRPRRAFRIGESPAPVPEPLRGLWEDCQASRDRDAIMGT
jgi:hypothetical protein